MAELVWRGVGLLVDTAGYVHIGEGTCGAGRVGSVRLEIEVEVGLVVEFAEVVGQRHFVPTCGLGFIVQETIEHPNTDRINRAGVTSLTHGQFCGTVGHVHGVKSIGGYFLCTLVGNRHIRMISIVLASPW